jgi:hypothetical protein
LFAGQHPDDPALEKVALQKIGEVVGTYLAGVVFLEKAVTIVSP